MEERYDESGLSSQLVGSHGLHTKSIVCSVCGAQSWTETTVGFYICRECGTQSQYISNELSEFDDHGGGTGNTIIRRSTLGKQKVNKYVTSNDILNNELIESKLLLNIFQYLLQQQLQHIIDKYNIDSSIKQHVSTVWFAYLQWWCNNNWGADERYCIVNKAGASYRKVDRILPVMDELHNEDTSDLPEPYGHDTNVKIDDTVSATDGDNQSNTELLSPGDISMELSIVILYIACNRLQTNILMNDIRQWIINGELPYLNIQQSIQFPAELTQQLKLHDNVRYFFSARQLPPRVTELHKLANTVNRRVQTVLRSNIPIDELPILQLNINELFYRLINQLSLPIQILELSLKLFTMLNSDIIDEQYIAACIVFIMKLCYGLDDILHMNHTNINNYTQTIPKLRIKRKYNNSFINNIRHTIRQKSTRSYKINSVASDDTHYLDEYIDNLPPLNAIGLFTRSYHTKRVKKPIDMNDNELIDYVGKHVVVPFNRRAELQPYIELMNNAVNTIQQSQSNDQNTNHINSHSNHNANTTTEPAYKSFVLYKTVLTGDLHKHYNILLNALSDIVGCTTTALHSTVQNIAKYMKELNNDTELNDNHNSNATSTDTTPNITDDNTHPKLQSSQVYNYLRAMKFPSNLLIDKHHVDTTQLFDNQIIDDNNE